MKKPLILEVKGNSLDDGPGIRTVVFFKGCPLSCVWCHNPESKSAGVEISYDRQECVGCNNCIQACPENAINRDNKYFIDREKCDLCFECLDHCPSGALSRVGSLRSIEEVVDEIKRDLPFFKNSGGGVTLSGGEPALFMEYAGEITRRLKKLSIHVLIETCGKFNYDSFEKFVYPNLDIIYFDIKILDSENHKKYCGVSNEIILDNFTKLYKKYQNGGIEILPRIPLIPGITATDENLSSIADYLNGLCVEKVSLLPNNPLWGEKSEKLGKGNAYKGRESMGKWMKRDQVEKCRSFFRDFKIEGNSR